MYFFFILMQLTKFHGVSRGRSTVNEFKGKFSTANATVDVRGCNAFKRNVRLLFIPRLIFPQPSVTCSADTVEKS